MADDAEPDTEDAGDGSPIGGRGAGWSPLEPGAPAAPPGPAGGTRDYSHLPPPPPQSQAARGYEHLPPPPPPPGSGPPPPPYGYGQWQLPKAGDARTGPLPLHPMTLSDILDGAFKLYKANARSLIAITAAFVVPVQLVAAFLQRGVFGGQSIISVFNDPATADTSTGNRDVALLIVLLTSWLVMPFVAGAISRVVAGSYLGHEIEPADALRATRGRWWALISAAFLVHVCEGLGLFFCIVPGLLMMALFVATAPSIVVESLGPIQGMRRSARLTRSRIWAVLGTAVVAGLLSSAIGAALGFIPDLAAYLVGLEWGWLLLAAGSILAGIVTTPFVAIVSTLIYFDGRIRWEGFDLAVMAADVSRRNYPYGAPRA